MKSKEISDKKGTRTIYVQNGKLWKRFLELSFEKYGLSGSRRAGQLVEEDVARMEGKESRPEAGELEKHYLFLECEFLKNRKKISEIAGVLLKIDYGRGTNALQACSDFAVQTFRFDRNNYSNLDETLTKLKTYKATGRELFDICDLELYIQPLERHSVKQKIYKEIISVRTKLAKQGIKTAAPDISEETPASNDDPEE